MMILFLSIQIKITNSNNILDFFMVKGKTINIVVMENNNYIATKKNKIYKLTLIKII